MMTKQHLIRLIHVACNGLSIGEDAYRQMLQGLTDKVSTRGMDITQLSCVLESVKRRGFRAKSAGEASSGLPLGNHPQSRRIRALWLEMAATGIVRDRSGNALARQIKQETGISALRWLSTEQASSVIEKLKRRQHRAAGVRHGRPESVSE